MIELSTRRVRIAGMTASPSGEWLMRVGREFAGGFGGFLLGHRYLINDLDPLFTRAFDDLLRSIGTAPVRLPPRSPKLNA